MDHYSSIARMYLFIIWCSLWFTALSQSVCSTANTNCYNQFVGSTAIRQCCNASVPQFVSNGCNCQTTSGALVGSCANCNFLANVSGVNTTVQPDEILFFSFSKSACGGSINENTTVKNSPTQCQLASSFKYPPIGGSYFIASCSNGQLRISGYSDSGCTLKIAGVNTQPMGYCTTTSSSSNVLNVVYFCGGM